jgi:hypothetical protein
MKIREQAKLNLQNREGEIFDLIKEMVENSHTSTNSHNLYIHTNGDVWISEEVSDNTWSVIPGTTTPIASLLHCYNSCGCNCDWCSDPDYVFDISDFSEEIDYSIEQAIERLEDVDEGYFDDENAD